MFAKKLFLVCAITLVFAFATACENETLVTKVDPTKPRSQKTDGVLFSLPETVVVAEVPLTKVDSQPGVFHDWTEFFYPELTSDDYVTEEKIGFKVGAPTFSTRGQTDPNNVYIAHIKAKQFETKTMLLEFNEDGIIAHADVSSKDETIDIVTSGIKTAASIVGPLLPFGAGGAPPPPGPLKAAGVCNIGCFYNLLSEKDQYLFDTLDPNYVAFLGNSFGYPFLAYVAKQNNANIALFLTLNEKQRGIIEGTVAKPRVLSLQDKLDLAKAKTAFDKIEELRQKREAIMASDTPPAVTTSTNLELKLKEIDAQIKTTQETFFLGSSAETSATAKFEFKPNTALLAQPLFTYASGGSKPGICAVSSETADFKAIWPRKLGGASCHAVDYLFAAGDFRDVKQLAAKLNPPAGGAVQDPVSAYLYSQLGGATRGWLAAPFSTPQARKRLLTALIADLNAVLSGPSIHGSANFDQVKLSATSLDLLAKPPAALSAAELIQLNRSLIEDAYADEIYRQKAWASHQISLSLDPPPGTPVVPVTSANANELEPGKRGFPYRVAASTLARLLDDGIEKGRSGVKIAQFGPVRTLPAGLGGRRSSYSIVYYDATGAIKTFNMSADALIQKQNITDLTDAATTLRDSQAAKLKRDTDLLKAKKDKLDAEKALKTAQGEPSPKPTPQ